MTGMMLFHVIHAVNIVSETPSHTRYITYMPQSWIKNFFPIPESVQD